MNCKTLTLAAATAFACAMPLGALTLEEGFKAPPRSAKPHTWYHMMNGNVTKEGITCDFEALAKAGIGGVQTVGQWIVVAVGYIGIIFVMFSGARRLEIRQNKNYGSDPEYQAYVKSVPILVPFIPLYSVEKYKWLVA